MHQVPAGCTDITLYRPLYRPQPGLIVAAEKKCRRTSSERVVVQEKYDRLLAAMGALFDTRDDAPGCEA